ncbi:class I adenylate-forming enzyme family protein [Minwuia thermotolerans]|uniref:class I adenylate-forming enzyme family protein n=1 Tax=Minwuia thermotolerans TaxID=2056226 RepID=UPI000D6DC3E8|nr:class I adenylate-forming enzyme family protein [Minwuia thermotolerans]
MWDMVGQRSLVRAIEHNREAFGEKSFIEYGDLRVTWAGFGRAVCQVANGLARRGVEPGQNVMIYLPNCPEHVIAKFGIQRLGAVEVTCSTLNKADEIAYQIAHGGCAAVIHDAPSREMVEDLAAASPNRPRCIAVDCGRMDMGAAAFNRMLSDESDRLTTPFPDTGDLAMIMYTSGTTGRPKGVMYTHGNLYAGALNGANGLQYSRNERVLHFFPLYHNNGSVVILGPIILRGATMVMLDRFSASRFGEMLAEHAITFTALNSTHVKMILEHPVTAGDRNHRMYRAQFALPLDLERRQTFSDRFGGVTLVELYGQTESLGAATICPVDALWKAGSAGPPVPGVRLAIADDERNHLGAGQPGEILLQSYSPHGLTPGYYDDPDATATLYAGGWLNTGDVGSVDEEGYLWFLERKKDMIKRSGFNVAAAEVERVIMEITGVQEVAVVGIPDEFREERIVAFIVPQGDAAPAEAAVIEHCRRFLADYKVPAHVASVDELPENFLGKVEKRTLRDLAVGRFGE